MNALRSWWLAPAVVGGLGGALAQASTNDNVAAGAAGGGGLALLWAWSLRGRVRDLGDGLLHGLALALLLWLSTPLFAAWQELAVACSCDAARERFPELVAAIVCYGAPLGLALGAVAAPPRVAAGAHGTSRALVVGGIAGFAACLLFERVAATAAPFGPVGAGATLRLFGAMAIGAGYGLLFQRAVRGLGQSLGFGIAWGMLWWCLGPLTALPWWRGDGVDWSAAAVGAQYGAFVAHVVFGLVLGLAHACVDKLWFGFFVASDPLQRDREGLGGRAVLALAWGALAGLVGGVVFAPAMWDRGMLPYVAQALGGSSPWFGLAVHLGASVLFGMVYGLLFRAQVLDLATALGSGLLFGFVLWLLGQLTLFPHLLGEPFDWSLPNAAAALPSLVGHLVYGAAMAFVFVACELRHARVQAVDPRWRGASRALVVGSAAPLWLFVLGFGVTLPVVLG